MDEIVVETKPPNFFLWTIQIAQWKKLKKPGMHFIDTTAKSGIFCFAPEMENVMAYKRGEMSEQEYRIAYREKMDESRMLYREYWDRLSVFPYVAYACYCRAGEFCHRHMFVQFAKEHLEGMGWTPKLMGEFTGDLGEIEIPEMFIRAEDILRQEKEAKKKLAT